MEGIPTFYERDIYFSLEDFSYVSSELELRRTSQYKAIVTENDKLVSIVSKKYKLIQHTEVLDKLEISSKLFKESVIYKSFYPLDTKAVMYATLMFKNNMQIEIKPKDTVSFGIQVINSVDSSQSLTVLPFSLRLVCKNGMTHKEFISKTMKKHYDSATEILDNLTNIILETVEKLYPLANLYKEYANTPLSCSLNEIKSIKLIPEKYKSKVYTTKIETVWDLFNVLTQLNTHDPRRNLNTKSQFNPIIEKICNEAYQYSK